jgi:hypothetical protein
MDLAEAQSPIGGSIMKTSNRYAWIAVGAFVVPSTTAFAQQEGVPNWSITPYIWAPTTTVDLIVRDTNIGGGDIAFSDLVDSLDAAFILQVEGGKGKWSAFGDLNYLETSDSSSRTVFTIDVRNKQTFLDAAVAYWPGGGDYYDALIGLRYRFDFSDRWSLQTRADTSFGDSEGTFLVRANFGYIVGQRQQNRVHFGYQYKQAEFKDGDLVSDFTFHGPMAGFSFVF